MGKKKVQVKNYSDRKKMERDVEKMLNDGYHIESQTGKFDERPRLI